MKQPHVLVPLLALGLAMAFPGRGLAADPAAASAPAASAASSAYPASDPRAWLQFVEDFAGTCVSRGGVQYQIKNTNPRRAIRVWLDRYLMDHGTGDRSRSDLKPGAAPEPLGCSRSLEGAKQEWRIVRAQFLD